ncbi:MULTISPECIES: hypothetical protein [Gemella]|nr:MULTISPECIES: hypothetical protein [Gemella]
MRIMFNIEKRIINHIEKYITYYFVILMSILGIIIRYIVLL